MAEQDNDQTAPVYFGVSVPLNANYVSVVAMDDPTRTGYIECEPARRTTEDFVKELKNEDPYTNGELSVWYTMQQQLAELKDQEIALRRKLVKYFFPDITEGTTTRRLPDGVQIKGEGKVTRKVVEDVFLALRDEFANDHHLPLDQLVKWKPELSVSAYRGLTDEQREVFDQVLEISDGAPTLKIVPAKKARDPL